MRIPRTLVLLFLVLWGLPASPLDFDAGAAAGAMPARASAGVPAYAAASPYAARTPALAPAASPGNLALPAAAAAGAPAAAPVLPAAPTPAVAAPAATPAITDPKAASAGIGPAGDGAGKEAGDALFDARRLHQDDAIGLIIAGYRVDDAGHLLAPKTGAALTNAGMRDIQKSIREQRNRAALLRLDVDGTPGASGSHRKALTELNRDALPREVVEAQKNLEKERPTTLRRLASLYRRWLAKEPTRTPASVEPAGGEIEKELGELVSAAVVKRLAADPEGARLLSELKDANGRLRLPAMRVLRLDARFGALYTSYGRQLIVSLDELRQALVPRLPAAERADAEKRLSSEAGALEYFTGHPEKVELLAEVKDITFFHELVHFLQNLRLPLSDAINREEAPAIGSVEMEYEAYHRQDLYIHSLLSRPNARLDVDRVDDYLRLIDGFEGWKDRIDRDYEQNFLNGEIPASEIAALQARSHGLMKRLADDRSPTAQARLAGAERGDAAVAAEKKAGEDLLVQYRREWPALARSGLQRLAQLYEQKGSWPQAAAAHESLARIAVSEQEAAASRAKADEAERRALIRLGDGDGLSLQERLDWIAALVSHTRSIGLPWKRDLWIASFRDYAQEAARARTAGDLSRAKDFEETLAANRVELRREAQVNLDALKAGQEPAQAALTLEWGTMQAGVLGDPALIAAFEQFHAPVPAAH